jgi:hypothetical protein
MSLRRPSMRPSRGALRGGLVINVPEMRREPAIARVATMWCGVLFQEARGVGRGPRRPGLRTQLRARRVPQLPAWRQLRWPEGRGALISFEGIDGSRNQQASTFWPTGSKRRRDPVSPRAGRSTGAKRSPSARRATAALVSRRRRSCSSRRPGGTISSGCRAGARSGPIVITTASPIPPGFYQALPCRTLRRCQ